MFKLDVDYIDYDKNSTIIDLQAPGKINRRLKLIVNFVKIKIDQFFNKGHSFKTLFKSTPLCFIDINQILLKPNYGDFFLSGGFTPDYNPSLCPG